MVKTFIYKKLEGEISERYVWEVHPASDKMLAIDLSEYSEADRKYYVEQLQDLYDVLKEDIKQLGLGSNYRFFKKDRIVQ